jgi:hypothetical protein
MFEVILTAVITLVTTLVPGGIIFYRQNKRIKNAEAKGKEIENIARIIDQWQETVAELKDEKEEIKKDKQDVTDNYNNLIVSYRNELNKYEELMKENKRLELANQELCWWKCVVRGCPNRKPPRVIDEMEEHIGEDVDNEKD